MSTDFRDLLDDLARADTVSARVTPEGIAHARQRRRTRRLAGGAAGVLALGLLAGGTVRLGSDLLERPLEEAGAPSSVVMPTEVLIPAFDAPALVDDGAAAAPRVTAVLGTSDDRGRFGVYALDAATGRAYRVDAGDVDDTDGSGPLGGFAEPVVSPDGSLVGYLADEAAVVVDLDAGSVQTVPFLTHNTGDEGTRSWALLNSAVLVYVEDDGDQVHVVDLETGSDRALPIVGAFAVRPASRTQAYVSFFGRAGLPLGGFLDVRTGEFEEVQDFGGFQTAVVGPGGHRLAAAVALRAGSRLVVQGSVGGGDKSRRLPGVPTWEALGWTRQGVVLHHYRVIGGGLSGAVTGRALFLADPSGAGPLRRWTTLPTGSGPPSLATGALAEAVLVPAPELPWWDPAADWLDDQPLEVPLLALASLVAVVWAIRRERSRRLP